jgi:hypothetical protein
LSDDFRPYARVHVGVSVEHDAAETDAVQGVGIPADQETDIGLVPHHVGHGPKRKFCDLTDLTLEYH